MRTHRLGKLTILLSAILAVTATSAQPARAAVALSELLVNGASLNVGGNLVFDEFTYSATGQMPSANGLLVDPYTDSFGNLGIRIVGGMTDSPGGSPSAINLGYRVSSIGNQHLLTAAVAAGNPAVTGKGSFVITESFSQVPTTLTIFDLEPGSTKLLDSAALPSSLTSLNVQLSAVATATHGRATASFIDQTFTLGDNVIPEPASLVIWMGTLLVFGIVPVMYRRGGLVAVRARVAR